MISMSQACSQCFISINWLVLCNNPRKIGIAAPFIQMNKLRHRESKSSAQGHRTSKRHSCPS